MISPGELEIMRRNTGIGAKRKPLEKEIETMCSQILAFDGWRSLKTDPVSDRKRGKGFGELGMADRLYIRYGHELSSEVMWIEWKREGGIVSEHQKLWHERERARGARVLVAGHHFPATVDGFCEFYDKSGLKRNRA